MERRLQARPLRCVAQRDRAQFLARQRFQRDQLGRTGDRGQDKPRQVVQNGSRDQLAKRTGIAIVGPIKRVQVALPLALLDYRRRVAEADEYQVHKQPSDASVAVNERMDALEGGVVERHGLADSRRIAGQAAQSIDPIAGERGHLRVVRRLHPASEPVDVVPAPVARPFGVEGVRMWRHSRSISMISATYSRTHAACLGWFHDAGHRRSHGGSARRAPGTPCGGPEARLGAMLW